MTQEDFEKKVMKMFLDCDDDLFAQLRMQYMHTEVKLREFTGRGFLTYFRVPDKYKIDCLSGRMNDVFAHFDDSPESYIFILYIENGKIDALEGFAARQGWEDNYDKAHLVYKNKDQREYTLTSNTQENK